jgi:hypothetical protein
VRHSLLALTLLVACSHALPPRGVLERDLGPYRFRRYQEVHDVELSLAENPALGHTATYLRGGDNLRIAPVFVTSYQRAEGVAAGLISHLKAMDGYTTSIVALHGQHVARVVGDQGDGWLLWPSKARVVKLGVPEGEPEVPDVLVAAYLEAYPSDLQRDGSAK